MKKRVYSEWKKKDRKDKYEIKGLLRIGVHFESESYETEEKINLIVVHDDLPF